MKVGKLTPRAGGVTDACAVCKILHFIECAWGSSCPQYSRRPKHILRAVSLCGNAQISFSKIGQ